MKLLPLWMATVPHVNQTILITLLDRCRSMTQLKRIHARLVISGLSRHNRFASKIVLFAAVDERGDINYAYKVLRAIPSPNAFTWNALIRGHSSTPQNPNRSFSIFAEMLHSGVSPDHLTFPFLLKSCARLSSARLGEAVHGLASKTGTESDLFVQNSLIHMYASCGDIASARTVFEAIAHPNLVSWNALIDGNAKCGDMAGAREAFDGMPERNVVSWSALINGYVEAGEQAEALATFDAMLVEGPAANDVTLVSALKACAHLSALDRGRAIHRYIESNGLRRTLTLSTSLVDMYAKCGAMAEALSEFRGVPPEQTDVLIWNAMIGGLAMHGMTERALELFEEMRRVQAVSPDEITCLALLSACAHGGLVKEAWSVFKLLEKQGMTPKAEHYACMMDVLARSGRVDEAFGFLNTMPFRPSASTLGALLSGCQRHGRADVGELIGKRLILIDPDHDGRYVGLSNIYAVSNRWGEAENTREAMEKRRVKKAAGYSWVEVDGRLRRFIAHDKADHHRSDEVYLMVECLVGLMRVEGDHDFLKDYDFSDLISPVIL